MMRFVALVMLFGACHNPEDTQTIQGLERQLSDIRQELASKALALDVKTQALETKAQEVETKAQELESATRRLDTKDILRACVNDANDAYWNYIALNVKLTQTVKVGGKVYAVPPTIDNDRILEWARENSKGARWEITNVSEQSHPRFDEVATDLTWRADVTTWDSADRRKGIRLKECELKWN